MTLTYKSGYRLVKIWGGFSIRGQAPLERIEGHFNQYKHGKIIDENLLPFVEEKHGGTTDFVPREDNCGAHRGKSVDKYLREKAVERMKWPSQSPDPNLVENVCALFEASPAQASEAPYLKRSTIFCSTE